MGLPERKPSNTTCMGVFQSGCSFICSCFRVCNVSLFSTAGAMRPASPVVVVSLLILIVALGFSTVGNSKRDYKTLIGAVLYVVGGI